MGSTWDTWSRRIAPTLYQIAVFGGILRKLLSDLVSPPHANASYLPCVSIPNFSGFVGSAEYGECVIEAGGQSSSARGLRPDYERNRILSYALQLGKDRTTSGESRRSGCGGSCAKGVEGGLAELGDRLQQRDFYRGIPLNRSFIFI
jgi:hypothetical protein